MATSADDVLDFWFTGESFVDLRKTKWFPDAKSQHLERADAIIKNKFSETLHLAEEGKLDHWTRTLQGKLALVIVLDQFSRHIYRAERAAEAENASKSTSNTASSVAASTTTMLDASSTTLDVKSGGDQRVPPWRRNDARALQLAEEILCSIERGESDDVAVESPSACMQSKQEEAHETSADSEKSRDVAAAASKRNRVVPRRKRGGKRSSESKQVKDAQNRTKSTASAKKKRSTMVAATKMKKSRAPKRASDAAAAAAATAASSSSLATPTATNAKTIATPPSTTTTTTKTTRAQRKAANAAASQRAAAEEREARAARVATGGARALTSAELVFALMPLRHTPSVPRLRRLLAAVRAREDAINAERDDLLCKFRRATDRRLADVELLQWGKPIATSTGDSGEAVTMATTPEAATAAAASTAAAEVANEFDGAYDILERREFHLADELQTLPREPLWRSMLGFLRHFCARAFERTQQPSQSQTMASESSSLSHKNNNINNNNNNNNNSAAAAAVATDEGFGSGVTLCVSLSGGVDSMVIAYILARMRDMDILPRQTTKLLAAHIDYGNRPESHAESEFVEDWCSRHGFECVARRIDEVRRGVTARDDYEKVSREIRYGLYAELIRSHENCFAVMFGHHRGDVEENVLSNVLRGVSVMDLGGMSPESKNIKDVTIWRPLLRHPKQKIYDFAHYYGVPYFKDTTPKWSTRGKMRNNLLPMLQDMYGDGMSSHLSHLARESAQLAALVNENVFSPLWNACEVCKCGVRVPYKDHAHSSTFFWSEALRHICNHMLGTSHVREHAVQTQLLPKFRQSKASQLWLRKDLVAWIESNGYFWLLNPRVVKALPVEQLHEALRTVQNETKESAEDSILSKSFIIPNVRTDDALGTLKAMTEVENNNSNTNDNTSAGKVCAARSLLASVPWRVSIEPRALTKEQADIVNANVTLASFARGEIKYALPSPPSSSSSSSHADDSFTLFNDAAAKAERRATSVAGLRGLPRALIAAMPVLCKPFFAENDDDDDDDGKQKKLKSSHVWTQITLHSTRAQLTHVKPPADAPFDQNFDV